MLEILILVVLVCVHGLTSLQRLWLHVNSISDISALSGLTKLTRLWLHLNSISDISALMGLTALGEEDPPNPDLNLADNPNLTEIQPLLNNPGLGVGDIVSLNRTNVSCTDVAALRAKGVTVTSDCP